MKVRLKVAYDGTAYHGWQHQPDVATVEGTLMHAACQMLNVPEVKIQGASRTDAGVHALGQTAHISFDAERRPWDFARSLNALTPEDICVVRVEHIDDAFHARHDARGKIYEYRIWNHRFAHPLELRRTWHVRARLDLDLMRQAASELVGTHDFQAFRAQSCDARTTVRQMHRVDIVADGPSVRIIIEGSAFLKYMVRVLTGTLIDVARGHLPPERIQEMLSGQADRGDGGQTAPPKGLTLCKIHYPTWPWADPQPEIGQSVLPAGER